MTSNYDRHFFLYKIDGRMPAQITTTGEHMAIEFLKRLRFLWLLACVCAGGYAMVYAPIKPIASVVIALVAGLAPYISWRYWFIIVALEWLAFCAAALYGLAAEGAPNPEKMIEAGLIGAPIIALVGWAISWLAGAFLPKRQG